MRIIGPSEVTAALDFTSLVEALRQMFRTGCEAPLRHHHTISDPAAKDHPGGRTRPCC